MVSDSKLLSEWVDTIMQTSKNPEQNQQEQAHEEQQQNDNDSPFLTNVTPCPVCESETVYKYLKTRLYVERDKEIDLRPGSLQWLKKGFENLQPRIYFMRHCPECGFTAGNNIFKNPWSSTSLSQSRFLKNFQIAVEKPGYNVVASILRQGISVDNLDYLQAVKLHLLAIYQLQQTPGVADCDAMDLGRYCLRLAWLYRDLKETKDRRDFAREMTHMFKELQKNWQSFPSSEPRALALAAFYYRTTYEKSHTVANEVDELNLLMLTTRILLKMGKVREAHGYLTLSLEKTRAYERKAQESLRELNRQKKEAQLSAEQSTSGINQKAREDKVNAMLSGSRKMKNQVGELKGRFEDIKEIWEHREEEKAREILERFASKSKDEQRSILVKQKIDKTVIMKLLPEKSPKKKFQIGILVIVYKTTSGKEIIIKAAVYLKSQFLSEKPGVPGPVFPYFHPEFEHYLLGQQMFDVLA